MICESKSLIKPAGFKNLLQAPITTLSHAVLMTQENRLLNLPKLPKKLFKR